jgi:hypothetical protein
MGESCNIPHPLQREGTYQFERYPAALSPDYVKLDERTTEELLVQAARFAECVIYYNDQNLQDGDWTQFFEEVYDYQTNELRFSSFKELEDKGATSPHIGLFIAFLKLYGFSQIQLNGLTEKQLDFYYKDILRLYPLAEEPDKVAVLFEPEKNTAQANVPAGTVLLAGKDDTGKPVYFKTNDDLVVNKAKVAEVKTVFVKKESDEVVNIFGAANALTENIVDPTGEIKSWRAFGSTENAEVQLGFAFASPLLNLPEAKRRVTLELQGINNLKREALIAEYTSAKGWQKAEVDKLPGLDNNSSDSLQYLLVKLDPGDPAMVPYNEAIHKAGFTATHPVIRITLDNSNEAEFGDAYTILKSVPVSSIKLTVNVAGLRSLIIQNDGGVLDPAKPFFPFGSQPVKYKSTLYIGNYEAFNKYLKSFHISMNWKGIPGNMKKHYAEFGDAGDVFLDQWRTSASKMKMFQQGHPPGKVSILDDGTWKNLPLNDNAHYQDNTKKETTNTFKPKSNALKSDYEYNQPKNYAVNSRWGFIKIELGYDFGHAYYPKLLTAAAIAKTDTPATPLPNFPYTPEFNSLHIDYVAQATIDLDEHALFHLHPFGVEKLEDSLDTLIPDYSDEGNLLIGLSGVNTSQVVSVFFQLHNDTGDLDKEINEDNKITWSYLDGNNWQSFGSEQIIKNTTLNFSTTGFIKFNIPSGAISTHNILTDGLVWLKGAVPKDSSAYPYIIGIETQAIEAVYDKRDNDPARLLKALPAGAITKLESRITGIKKVTQPYASYDGRPEEVGGSYYTRVSERLRHKGRAWGIWDYERLVLEKFPSIFKVKCISHSNTQSEYVTGNVLLVLLPNPANVNFQNALQPRVSKSVIELVKEYMATLTSAFAHIDIINPQYEPLQIICDVKIRPEYGDEAYYSNQLKKDLAGFIAPWSVDSSRQVSFEGRIYQSQIIDFIEERPYIDYVTNFEVIKTSSNVKCTELIMADKESSIITSVSFENHIVNTNATC